MLCCLCFNPGYETASTDRAHTEILLLGRCVVEIDRMFHEPNPDAGVTDVMYISATVSHCHTLGCPRRVLHTREHKWTPAVTHHAAKYQPGCVLGGKLVQLGVPRRNGKQRGRGCNAGKRALHSTRHTHVNSSHSKACASTASAMSCCGCVPTHGHHTCNSGGG